MAASPAPIAPGAVIGILGGGQLGRMLATAAAELGLSCHIYCPDSDSPAFAVAAKHTIAAYDDKEALAAFASVVSVVTYEFENVPVDTVRFLADRAPVYPEAKSLELSQDRIAEKEMIASLGIGVPAFAAVSSEADLTAAIARVGVPAILKTRRLGYDGKGQARILPGDDPATAWKELSGAPAIVEAMVPFEREISVILARGRDGTMRAWDIPENRHVNGILAESSVPAAIAPEVAEEAVDIAEAIATALGHVGVLAVELFLVRNDGAPRLLVNEIAPRVHNSGHWTMDAALTSQFEQHIRAIAGWPLGDPERHSDVVMQNLIGAEVEAWPQILGEAGAHLHLYGKSEVRPGRKMGHVNRVRPAAKL